MIYLKVLVAVGVNLFRIIAATDRLLVKLQIHSDLSSIAKT